MNAVRTIGRAFAHAVQEQNFAGDLFHIHGEIKDPFAFGQSRQFMIVCGKYGQGPRAFQIGQVFHNRPRQRNAIVG